MKDDSILQDKLHPPLLGFDENLDDGEIFRQAMVEVRPLRGRRRALADRGGSSHGSECLEKRGSEKEALLTRDPLEELLSGSGESNWFCHVGYVEGGAREWDRPLLEKLRSGGFSVQAELDLHGLDQRQAPQRIEEFIRRCARRQLTCVRIVHGKGKNSRNHVPVLKEKIPHWLSFKRLCRYVVAYTSARPVDGGVGAIYVLIRGVLRPERRSRRANEGGSSRLAARGGSR